MGCDLFAGGEELSCGVVSGGPDRTLARFASDSRILPRTMLMYFLLTAALGTLTCEVHAANVLEGSERRRPVLNGPRVVAAASGRTAVCGLEFVRPLRFPWERTVCLLGRNAVRR